MLLLFHTDEKVAPDGIHQQPQAVYGGSVMKWSVRCSEMMFTAENMGNISRYENILSSLIFLNIYCQVEVATCMWTKSASLIHKICHRKNAVHIAVCRNKYVTTVQKIFKAFQNKAINDKSILYTLPPGIHTGILKEDSSDRLKVTEVEQIQLTIQSCSNESESTAISST